MIVLIIVFLFAIAMVIYLIRKKHINEILLLEDEKLQIQHQPIFEELTKLKRLNMTGETEEKFERWREEWTEVIDVVMPQIDTMLFDAEDAIDRLKFKKASAIEREIFEEIQKCDQKHKQILEELDELMGSEEKNRFEMEAIQENYRIARQTILAKQFDFGQAFEPLEKKLETFTPQFEEYEKLTEQGNYLTAREIVLHLTQESEEVFKLIDQTPTLLSKLNKTIPATMKDLRNGMRDMEEQQYHLIHLGIEEQLEQIEVQLKELGLEVKELNLQVVEEQLLQVENQMEQFYDLLEQEVRAKGNLQKEIEDGYDRLNHLMHDANSAIAEAEAVQRSYQLSVQEAALPEKLLRALQEYRIRYEDLLHQYNHPPTTYSVVWEEVEKVLLHIDQSEEELESFTSKIKNLRTDENRVREQLDRLTKQMQESDRLLHRSNMPGIPSDINTRMEEAEEKIYIAYESLNEAPIDMESVELQAQEAETATNDIAEEVEQLLANVHLIEEIIQYGNRYRLNDSQLDERLKIAERAFMDYRYTKALEEAMAAVEEVEPGALEKIKQSL
ncbi:septation ring formation regulator EzrA [Savagea faecisuis]|uniref:Septation ring formation regulator EzrA n=1 Tax=Savagea faecisuis TaxID=1274803 RepID=A0ABW3H3T6_9BACL